MTSILFYGMGATLHGMGDLSSPTRDRIHALEVEGQSPYKYTFFFIFFTIMVYHRTLNIVPCATLLDPVVYLSSM